MENELLTTQSAAERLGVHRSFLDRRRVAGGGPRYIRLSARVVRYAVADLDIWLSQHRLLNSSQQHQEHQDV